MSPSDAVLAPGTILAGRFRIAALLGAGAMGEVYAAEDLELGEPLAVKVLVPAIARDPDVSQRFKREVQLARRVTHPNACRLFDLAHHRLPDGSDLAFLTMELLPGEPLEARLARDGPLAPAEALEIARQTAAALTAAHQAGVVHRDFKTGNVLLAATERGPRAVVTDFGLAWSDSSSSLTGNDLVGSPITMAPEQVRGEPVSPAADVYAFGVVLYEMVTGRLPFEADTALATALLRLSAPPVPPRRHRPDLDPLWEEVILRCLEREPARRFATPLEAVQVLAGERPLAAAPPDVVRRPLWRSPAVWALAGALLGLPVVGGLVARRLAPPDARPAAGESAVRPAVAVLGFANLAGDPGAAYVETSLVQMLPVELSVGGRLRLIASEEVDRMRRDLGIAAARTLSPDTLARVRRRLGADYVVTGAYLAARGWIRCDVSLQETATGELVAAASQTVPEEQVLELVAGLGERLRAGLGVPGGAAEVQAARAELPGDPRTARLYAEALAHLDRFEARAARDLLARVVAAEPGNPLPRVALSAAWSALGFDARAAEEARRAVALSGHLRPEERRRVEARYLESVRAWDQAAALYRELWEAHPDELSYGLRLAAAETNAGRADEALTTVAAMRRLPAPLREAPAIDLAEAEAALARSELGRQLAAARRAAAAGRERGARLVVARARFYEGLALLSLGRLEEAAATAAEASEIFLAAADRVSAARALNSLASVRMRQGDFGTAQEILARVLALGRESGNLATTGAALVGMGSVLRARGDLEGARRRFEEARGAFRRLGDAAGEAAALTNLGNVLQTLGRPAEARAHYDRALPIFQRLGQREAEATVLVNLADLAFAAGDLDRAEDLYGRAGTLFGELGVQSGVAESEGGLGRVLAARGDLAAGRRRLTAALGHAERLGERELAARLRRELARLVDEQAAGRGGPQSGAEVHPPLKRRGSMP